MTKTSKNSRKLAIGLFCLAVVLVFLFKQSSFMQTYSLGIDPSNERCLPEVHLTVLKRIAPVSVRSGDLVFFKPDSHFTWVKTAYILKRVAGIEGDHLVIKGDRVSINGKLLVSGFPLAKFYRGVDFSRDEIIPKGELFLVGTHPLSDDSRYWGYEHLSNIEGTAHAIF